MIRGWFRRRKPEIRYIHWNAAESKIKSMYSLKKNLKVFISHGRGASERLRRLLMDFDVQEAGIRFEDVSRTHALPAARQLSRAEIHNDILDRVSRSDVVILTAASGEPGRWSKTEIESALIHRKPVLVIDSAPIDPAAELGQMMRQFAKAGGRVYSADEDQVSIAKAIHHIVSDLYTREGQSILLAAE